MKKYNILVIDDEPSIIQSINRQFIIESENYEILYACNGKDGLEKYYSAHPILIILDLNMPVMDGIKFLENLRLTPLDPCAAIVMTGHDDDENIKKCFDLGVNAILRKPFNEYEFMGMVKNIIALKLTQQELKNEIAYRKLMLETLNNQRENFISVLMHDLKNPLIPITHYINKIIDGNVKSEKDKIDKLKIVRESSRQILGVIESTSNALRTKAGLQSFNQSDLSFEEILLSVINTLMPGIEDRGIEIYINNKKRDNWKELEKINLKGDFYQIKTLMENLLGNAIKYAKAKIRVSLNKSDNEVHLAIEDDGQGIDEIYHDKIFEEYFQVPGSKKGTGLGLYSVKKVVENHNGKITVNSSPDSGTIFKVIFPLNNLQ